MATTTDLSLSTLVLNLLTQEQYNNATKYANELYLISNIDNSEVFVATYGSTTFEEITTALTANKICICVNNTSSDSIQYGQLILKEDSAYYFTTSQNLMKVSSNNTWTIENINTNDTYLTKIDPNGTGSLSLNRKSNSTIGTNSVALGINSTASGQYSMAEGEGTSATGKAAHAEGCNTKASGTYSHAEGNNTTAQGLYSHAEGYNTKVTQVTTATPMLTESTNAGYYGHAEGYGTLSHGLASHAEGNGTSAKGVASHSEGLSTTASGANSHAEGNHGIASGVASHVEGGYLNSKGEDPIYNTASGDSSHAEGASTTASGNYSHAEGVYTMASGDNSHAEGSGTLASGGESHAEGYGTCAEGLASHSEGDFTTASGYCSHAEGRHTTASGDYSHASGCDTTASGDYSHASGCDTTALSNQFVIGHYNNTSTGTAASSSGSGGSNSATSASLFIIGNGTSTSPANAFRVNQYGRVYCHDTYTSSGADYAEYFEWEDLNLCKEDRRGYFVTLDGEKIKIAEPGDYILGVISALPAIIGNGDEDWMNRYIYDEFGSFVYEEYEYEIPIRDKETQEIKMIKQTGIKHKENPDYDPTIQYTPREERPEWDAVGMIGVLAVRDDGTCKVNGYCQVAEGGIATSSENGYRVIKRINDHVIKIVFK